MSSTAATTVATTSADANAAAAAITSALTNETKTLIDGVVALGTAANSGSGSVVSAENIKAVLTPLAQQVTVGTVTGFAAGYAAKKVGKAVAVIAGLGFVGLQAAQYSGYIHVNWGKIENDVKGILDVNRDGKVDEKDLKQIYDRAYEIAKYALPSSGGFATGFVLGLKFA